MLKKDHVNIVPGDEIAADLYTPGHKVGMGIRKCAKQKNAGLVLSLDFNLSESTKCYYNIT